MTTGTLDRRTLLVLGAGVSLVLVLRFVRLITVLISVRLPGNHCNGLSSPRSHRPAIHARPPTLIFGSSAHLDVHLLAHILRSESFC